MVKRKGCKKTSGISGCNSRSGGRASGGVFVVVVVAVLEVITFLRAAAREQLSPLSPSTIRHSLARKMAHNWPLRVPRGGRGE